MSRCRARLALPALIVVLCALAAPAAVLAQGSPFQGLPPATPSQTETTTTTAAPVPDDSTLETWQGALIVAGGLALLTGIGLVIARDARRRAPVDDVGAGENRDAVAHKHARRTKERQRQKAKAARAARRRNR